MSDQGLNREISLIYDLLFGYTDKMKNLREELNLEEFTLPVQIALVIKMNNYAAVVAGRSEFQKEELKQQINTNIKRLAGKYLGDILLAPVDQDLFLLFFSPPRRLTTRKFAEFLKEQLEQEMGHNFSLGLGRRYDNLQGLIFSYKEALNACKTGYFMGNKGIVHIDDLVLFKKDIPIFITEREEDLLEKIRNGDYYQLESLFKEIFDLISEEWIEPEVFKAKLTELFYKIIKETCKDEMDYRNPFNDFSSYLEKIIEADTKKDLSAAALDIFIQIVAYLNNKQMLNKKQEIKQALKSIEENYHNNQLTLSDVSADVGLSLYYFSHLFKREMGESFITYLNKVRINKAKELLLSTSLNIAETCYQVGYNDPNYFTRVFKEYEGVTPSEFKRKGIGSSSR